MTRFCHKVAERRGRKLALVAAARKLVTVCYSVLVNRRPYYNPLHARARGRLERQSLAEKEDNAKGANQQDDIQIFPLRLFWSIDTE